MDWILTECPLRPAACEYLRSELDRQVPDAMVVAFVIFSNMVQRDDPGA